MRDPDEYRCSGRWPAAPWPIPCEGGVGHRGPHRAGERRWTDEEAQALDARARSAAEDAWQRAYAAVVGGQEMGRVANVDVGLNRAERRHGRRPNAARRVR